MRGRTMSTRKTNSTKYTVDSVLVRPGKAEYIIEARLAYGWDSL
jgi:hypothetical protein